MKDWLLIFIGGGLGSVSRVALGRWIATLHHQNFPWGTLFINIAACSVLGIVVGLADQRQLIAPSWRILWTVGFCGGFSTFSTFSAETLALLQGGLTTSAIAYVVLSVILCVMATFAGMFWVSGF